jgi:hypothetical protein
LPITNWEEGKETTPQKTQFDRGFGGTMKKMNTQFLTPTNQ